MRVFWWCLVLLLVGMTAGLFLLLRPRRPPPEPVYAGRTLSFWVSKYQKQSVIGSWGMAENDEAIRQIGTNAVPLLVQWVRYETPPWKLRWYRVVNPILQQVKPAWTLSDDKENARAEGAAHALMALGPKAEYAIVTLTRLLRTAKTNSRADLAATVLVSMGRAGLPPMMDVLTNEPVNQPARLAIVMHVPSFGTNARVALPALRQLLNDPDRGVRDAATNSIALIDQKNMR